MQTIDRVEIVIALLAVVVGLVALARTINVPYPIPLVLGGLVLGFVPGLPAIEMRSDLVLIAFLPPLLYVEAWSTSWRDFRDNLRPILLLAIGLVLTTTLAVAAVAHFAVPGVTWPVAFVLGAVVGPTDTVAAGVIAARLNLPRRIVTILQGESLVNDASALVLYALAVTAAQTGRFSPGAGVLEFLQVSLGGIALGLVIGWALSLLFRVIKRLDDATVANTTGLLVPFIAYLSAERLHLSGVLAVVAVGLYLGRRAAHLLSAEVRLQANGFWELLAFVLNGLLFILIGLQLKGILTALAGHRLPALLGDAALVSVTVILARIVWVFPATYLPRWLVPAIRRHDPYPPWQQPTVVAWAGIRGGISLAAALGVALPQRDLILFLTFAVILTTLVVQGLSLPPLIRMLDLTDDGKEDAEEALARREAAQTALVRLEDVSDKDGIPKEVLDGLRSQYEARSRRYRAAPDGGPVVGAEERAQAVFHLRRDLIAIQRRAVIRLRDQGAISDDILRRVENDLDLEEQYFA